MKYKLVGLILVFLLFSPAFGQEVSPVITVDFPRMTSPTTVITGQPFSQVVRIKFIDLSHKGEEILVREEDLYNLKFWGDFEVLSVSIDKQVVDRNFVEHVWYVNFSLRIVNEKKSDQKKGGYKLTSIIIPWARKRMGQDPKDSGLVWSSDVKTTEIPVNYVTTIPDDPHLDIRDQIDLGSFSSRTFWFKFSAWALAVVPLSLWLLALVRYRRTPVFVGDDKSYLDPAGEGVISGGAIGEISDRKALRSLRRQVRKLGSLSKDGKIGSESETMSALAVSIMDFLRTRVQGSSVGTTPSEMKDLIVSNTKDGKNPVPVAISNALLGLAEKAKLYGAKIENSDSDWSFDPASNAADLKKNIRCFSWYVSLWYSIVNLPARLKTGFSRKSRK